ncbi:hypothetical protein D5086_018235 [Populus alba]|uniref:Uncharacterized protein n=1 Tax=Populus alba TaxID=43335 RepID=A0ACC4BP39_POPAL
MLARERKVQLQVLQQNTIRKIFMLLLRSMLTQNYQTNKGNLLRASYAHYFDHEKKVAEAAVVSRMLSEKENVLVVGGTWIMDDKTTLLVRRLELDFPLSSVRNPTAEKFL